MGINCGRLETDKRTEEFTLRVPTILKAEVDRLSSHFKRRLNDRILVTMAKVIHEAKFDPRRYLVSEYSASDDDAM